MFSIAHDPPPPPPTLKATNRRQSLSLHSLDPVSICTWKIAWIFKVKAKNKWERSHNPMSKQQHNRNPETRSPKCACTQRERERESWKQKLFQKCNKIPKTSKPRICIVISWWVGGEKGKIPFSPYLHKSFFVFCCCTAALTRELNCKIPDKVLSCNQCSSERKTRATSTTEWRVAKKKETFRKLPLEALLQSVENEWERE